MFDTVKDFFGSIYGAFVIIVFMLGALLFAFSGNPLFFVGWCSIFLVAMVYKKNKMDKDAAKANIAGELQITTDVQEKAINDYVKIILRRDNHRKTRKPRKK